MFSTKNTDDNYGNSSSGKNGTIELKNYRKKSHSECSLENCNQDNCNTRSKNTNPIVTSSVKNEHSDIAQTMDNDIAVVVAPLHQPTKLSTNGVSNQTEPIDQSLHKEHSTSLSEVTPVVECNAVDSAVSDINENIVCYKQSSAHVNCSSSTTNTNIQSKEKGSFTMDNNQTDNDINPVDENVLLPKPSVVNADITDGKIGSSLKTNRRKHDERSDTVHSNNSEELLKIYQNEVKRIKRHKRYSQSSAVIQNYNLIYPNRPSESRWMQQKLPAWQPVFRPANIIITFLLTGILLLVVGTIMYLSVHNTQEIFIDYTNCTWDKDKLKTCAEAISVGNSPCDCNVTVHLNEDLHGPIYLYYGLDGFYQNHRRYVSSVNYKQLLGQDVSLSELQSSCSPYSDVNGIPIAPCGAIANSMFNDRFELFGPNKANNESSRIQIIERDISWPSDRKNRYKNPSGGFSHYAKPINWSISVDELDPKHPENNGYQNEHLIVWMRTAAFPKFRKLWGHVNYFPTSSNHSYLPAGIYNLKIEYNFRTVFHNLYIQKSIILSNTSWLGGKNFFLSYVYMFTGVFSILFACFFLCLLIRMRKQSEQKAQKETKVQYQSTSPRTTKTTEPAGVNVPTIDSTRPSTRCDKADSEICIPDTEFRTAL